MSRSLCLLAIYAACALFVVIDANSIDEITGFAGFLTRFTAHQHALSEQKRALEERKFEQFKEALGIPSSFGNDGPEYVKLRQTYAKNMVNLNELIANEQDDAEYGPTDEMYLSYDEFRRTRLGYRSDMRRLLGDDPSPNEVDFATVWKKLLQQHNKTEKELIDGAPEEVDWRKVPGVVSKVKNQGSCGSCWSFSTTGAVEGQYGLRNKSLSLSEEELVDCDTADEGCNGGLPQYAYEQIITLGGLETESDYPYNPFPSKKGCRMSKKAPKYPIKGFVNLPNNEEIIKAWVAYRGPVSIGINAFAMQFYRHGVSRPFSFLCSPKQLDHAVLIVGYGHDTSKKGKVVPYWIVKNSWSTFWGEKGYYRVYRGSNVCGVASDVSAPLLPI
ncbi:putative cysteine proteinase [Fragariocoptes setiger]|uniref:Cysteine proteinase n=1 Tax=Fragariocoptes setiger TaxID=1670756 RepID=A0ABQ7SBM6_9ACAR|nr:putative cysteine proteinase [Fragariocoptes setiger]